MFALTGKPLQFRVMQRPESMHYSYEPRVPTRPAEWKGGAGAAAAAAKTKPPKRGAKLEAN